MVHAGLVEKATGGGGSIVEVDLVAEGGESLLDGEEPVCALLAAIGAGERVEREALLHAAAGERAGDGAGVAGGAEGRDVLFDGEAKAEFDDAAVCEGIADIDAVDRLVGGGVGVKIVDLEEVEPVCLQVVAVGEKLAQHAGAEMLLLGDLGIDGGVGEVEGGGAGEAMVEAVR